jgi:hypothetical protein
MLKKCLCRADSCPYNFSCWRDASTAFDGAGMAHKSSFAPQPGGMPKTLLFPRGARDARRRALKAYFLCVLSRSSC